jgi:hypothetical protein
MRNFTQMTSSANRRAVISAQKSVILGKLDIDRLNMVVNDSINAFSITTHIAKNKVIEILGKINVEMLDDVAAAVENLNIIEGIDPVRIAVAVEETIKAIATTTQLETAQIFAILTAIESTSVEDIVSRLHEKSQEIYAQRV